MNDVNLIGRLTRDPEVRYTQGNMAVARFSIAIDRMNGGTDFPAIVAFGKTAENCEKYLSKGRQVGITGRIQTGSHEKDGRKIYTTDVVASRVEFLGGKSSNAESTAQESVDTPEGFEALDDDVPF